MPPALSDQKGFKAASIQSAPAVENQGTLPRVSIVTPSFNQAPFIEETIRSVLMQGYPNLEYIIMDGGSTDGSLDIIRRYERFLTYWVSKPDEGQCNAINEGWKRATGEIIAYLNSDDVLLANAIQSAVAALCANPSSVLVYSDGLWIDQNGRPIGLGQSGQLNIEQLLRGSKFGIPQPTVFMLRFAVEQVGWLDESLHMAMDLDLWLKLGLRYAFTYLPGKPLAALRWHPGQKTQTHFLADRLDSLAAFERALCDPQCPPGITHRESNAYRSLCLDLAGYYWGKRDWQQSAHYLGLALRSNSLNMISQTGYRFLIQAYVRMTPPMVRNHFRRLRSMRQPSQPDDL